MTALDWVIVAIVLLSVLRGLMRGFIVSVLSIVALIVGFLVAGQCWPMAMPWLHPFIHQIWLAQIASFFTIALLVILVFTLIAHLLRRAAAGVGMGWLDRLLGGAFGLLRGVVIVVLGFLIVTVLAPGAPWVQHSLFGPRLLRAAQQTLHTPPAFPRGRLL